MNLNPYEAPQTVALTDPAQRDPARDWADVRHGAQLNFYGLVIGVAVLFADILATQFATREAWSRLSWLLSLIGTIAVLMQIWGNWLIRRAPPESRVKRLVTGSLCCSILALFCYWSALGLSYLFDDFSWFLYGYHLNFAAQYLAGVLFFWSLWRLGRFTHGGRLRELAMAALIYFAVMNGYDLFELTRVIWSGDDNRIAWHFAQKQDYLGHPWQLVGKLSGYLLAGFTMRAVARISSFSIPEQHAESPREPAV